MSTVYQFIKRKLVSFSKAPSCEKKLYCFTFITYSYFSVEEVIKILKSFRIRFGQLRKLIIECLDKCQIAVVTVVTLLSSVLGFDVRSAVYETYHKDLSECKNNLELFGYLNLYWNYLSFRPLSLLIEEPALMNDVFASVRKEMCAYIEDIKMFGQNTSLVAFCSAVPYTEHDPPPGFQKMVTEHDWPETVTLREVEDFQKYFLEAFSLPVPVVMVDGIRRGSFRVTWFALLPANIIQCFKLDRGKMESLHSVEIDGELIYKAVKVSDIDIELSFC